jgi:hypothetical protein
VRVAERTFRLSHGTRDFASRAVGKITWNIGESGKERIRKIGVSTEERDDLRKIVLFENM